VTLVEVPISPSGPSSDDSSSGNPDDSRTGGSKTVKTETQIEISGHSGMSGATQTIVQKNAYERANCLTVLKCALEAIVGDRMEEHKRVQFLKMALARTDDLISQLKQDMAALDDPLEA